MLKPTGKGDDNRFEGVKELADAAAEILKAGGRSQEKGTVAEFPNERTIRYYITEGLLPPSVEKRGSASVFGYQHLLSLLVIKKLQSDGLPISIIRQLIIGRSEDELQELLGDEKRVKVVDDLVEAGGPSSLAQTEPDERFGEPVQEITGAAAIHDHISQQPEKNTAREYLEGLLFSRSANDEANPPLSRPAPPASQYTMLKSAAEPPKANSWRREEVDTGLEINIRDDYKPPAGYREMKKLLARIKEILRR